MKKFDNYLGALESLLQAPEQDLTNEFVQAGVINKFVLQFELGWKLLKALLAVEGDPKAATGSPRDVLKASFSWLDCLDEETWLSMLRDRNTVTHIYDAKNAELLASVIVSRYLPAFQRLADGVRGARELHLHAQLTVMPLPTAPTTLTAPRPCASACSWRSRAFRTSLTAWTKTRAPWRWPCGTPTTTP